MTLYVDEILFKGVYNEYSIYYWRPIILLYLIALIGLICSAIRRLHDVNGSGWLLLLALIPILNIQILYWLALPSMAGKNRFGDHPGPSEASSK